MTTALLAPSRSLLAADLLTLLRRRGLLVLLALLTVGASAVTYGVMALLHLASPGTHGPAGGIVNLGHGSFALAVFGAVAAVVVGASAGVGDLDAGVYRDLVVTGRSRLALYASRIPAGALLLLPFVAAGYALAAVASVALAGSNPLPGVGLLATTGLWVLLQVGFYYLVGLGLACLLGSRSYAIGAALAFRLALTPIVTSISSLGVVRELVPGAALQDLTPAGLGSAASQGGQVPMSVAAIAAVLLAWASIAVLAGAWRDTARDA